MLRNRVLALLEEATLQSDSAARRGLLTFVTAGRCFAGAETTGAINDFVREIVRYYPDLSEELFARHRASGRFSAAGTGRGAGNYAERKLRERKVEVIKGVRRGELRWFARHYDDGKSIPASTLIWTAGVKPSAVIAPLPGQKERGRLL